MKKDYRAPKLKTRRIELGVFGDYSNAPNGDSPGGKPGPVDVIRDLHLHMD